MSMSSLPVLCFANRSDFLCEPRSQCVSAFKIPVPPFCLCSGCQLKDLTFFLTQRLLPCIAMLLKDTSYIVLTGGAGFIGSGVLRVLNDEGIDNIVVVDNLGSTDKWKNLLHKSFAEVLHKEQLFDWLRGREKEISAIIHLGACTSTVERDANYLLENNYRYSVKLAQFAIAHGIRFIYASSAATYGSGAQGFSDQHGTLEAYFPLNMYGYSKHLFDLWLTRNSLLDRVVGLKYFNVFGPNEYHKGEMASTIFRFLPTAIKKGSIQLFKSSEPGRFADGDQVRDFIYIKDAARMTVQFLNNTLTGIFNIGMGIPHTWNSLAHSIGKALKKELEIVYTPMPDYLTGKYQNYTCADMSKTMKQNLIRPGFTFEEAVVDYVRSHLLPEKHW